jgi:hypothetical protein
VANKQININVPDGVNATELDLNQQCQHKLHGDYKVTRLTIIGLVCIIYFQPLELQHVSMHLYHAGIKQTD